MEILDFLNSHESVNHYYYVIIGLQDRMKLVHLG